MKCKICKSKNIKNIINFKPYNDKTWYFNIFECSICGTRFAERDDNINYHEEIHSTNNSPYMPHYYMASSIKYLLDNDDIEYCKNILIKQSIVVEKLLEYIRNKNKNISILELGCSSGYVTAYLQKIGYKNAVGVDISNSAVEYASSTFGNFYSLKEDDKKFDIIFHIGLIGCVDDPKSFLEYYLRLLNDGGVMFFNAPDVDSVQETEEIWVSTPPPDLIYLFKKDFFSKFKSNQYNVISAKLISPMSILRKYLNKYLNKSNNIYPRSFYIENKNNIKERNKILKNIVYILIFVLVKMKIIRHYSDDYGLIIEIRKL